MFVRNCGIMLLPNTKRRATDITALFPNCCECRRGGRMPGKVDSYTRARLKIAFSQITREHLNLRQISARCIIPPGSWELIGARRRRLNSIRWQRKGVDKEGRKYDSSYIHLTQNGRRAICGRDIPGAEDHTLYKNEVRYNRPVCYQCERIAATWGYVPTSVGFERKE